MKHRIATLLHSRVVITLLLALLILSLGGAAYGFKTTYVPGPVSAMRLYNQPLNGYSSHADFEKECLHCHAPVRCLSANLCQDCHLQIARERAESTGLHGLLPGTDKCHTCHPEHRGRDTALADVPFYGINHQRLGGFGLDKHNADYQGAPLTCESCHPGGRHDATSNACTACHAAEDAQMMAAHIDEHGRTCTGCHDGRDRMIGFDHNTVYALDGAHTAAGCSDCHPTLTFSGATRACVDCHPDPAVHAGKFGLDCRRCHTAAAWSPAQLTVHTFGLDHGAQGELACETCHSGTYAVYTCTGCHDHPPATMQELHAGEGIDELEPCARCHPTGAPGEAGDIDHGA
jgi:hypothetical protein